MTLYEFFSILYSFKLKYHIVDTNTPGLVKVTIYKKWWQFKFVLKKIICKCEKFLERNMTLGVIVVFEIK